MDDTRGFSQELGEPIVSAAMEAVLKTVSYDEALVDGWVDAICDKVMDDLLKLKLPYVGTWRERREERALLRCSAAPLTLLLPCLVAATLATTTALRRVVCY